jgi:hypothetical protein
MIYRQQKNNSHAICINKCIKTINFVAKITLVKMRSILNCQNSDMKIYFVVANEALTYHSNREEN